MKIQLSITTLLLGSVFAMAGGDLKPVEPEITVPKVIPVSTTTGFYAGLGYSCMQLATDTPDEEFMGNGISFNLGYDINDYLAIESRYTRTLDDVNYQAWQRNKIDKDLDDSSLSNAAIYLKPKFSIGGLGLYGLVGYGQSKLDNGNDTFTENSLQYGIGTNFTISNVDMFVDYRRLYDTENFDTLSTDQQDIAVNSFTVGVNYKF